MNQLLTHNWDGISHVSVFRISCESWHSRYNRNNFVDHRVDVYHHLKERDVSLRKFMFYRLKANRD